MPSLQIDGNMLTQRLRSLNILKKMYPEPALLPKHPRERAKVRALSQLVACVIHPLNNLRVLRYLRAHMEQPEQAVRHWLRIGRRRVFPRWKRYWSAAMGLGAFAMEMRSDWPTSALCRRW